MKLIFTAIILACTVSVQGQFRCQDLKQKHLAQPVVPSINNNAKSDTVDILHYHLALDLYDIASQSLKGVCTIHCVPKLPGVRFMNLDLLELTINGITLHGQPLNYSYNDTIIKVDLGVAYGPNDTLMVQVDYEGQPQGDASGWGGFHFQNGYYYNLGVGFAANPHTYGRVWFPCFDNFVEKSTYSFTTLTKSPNNAYCNGARTAHYSLGGDTLFSSWTLDDPIPTYLASVAVSTYEEISQSVNASNGQLPILLLAKAADTANLKASFQNLNPTLQAFEDYFGPYEWQKIGYAVTTRGAMEHATSIHYPNSLVNGNLSGEDIMAHELAHHWWGNLVTCETAEDMWINEGMAEFASHLYLEKVYDRETYLDAVQLNGYNVLNSAHIQDNGYKAISGLMHDYTYGFHVYQKGAMVAHNLRGYMGDGPFFTGLRSLLTNHKFGNLNTLQFRNQLEQISGVPLSDFFDGWVLQPGYSSLAIDSLSINTANTVYVRVAQNTYEAPALFKNIPAYVTFFSAAGDTLTRSLIVAGKTGSAVFSNLPFTPDFALVSYNGSLLTGDTYDEHLFTQKRFYVPRQGNVRFNVQSVQDSARMICMYHWAGPSGRIPSGKDYRVSKNRFWTFRGYDLARADFSARLTYDGSPNGRDQDLAGTTEDSLIVLYRAQPSDEWTIYPDQQKVDLGSSTNGLGYFDLDNPKAGDYVLANTSEKVGLPSLPSPENQIEIYPNPSQGSIHIRFREAAGKTYEVRVSDLQGKTLFYETYSPPTSDYEMRIELDETAAGQVIVSVGGLSQKIMLN